VLYLLREEGASAIARFVEDGGTLVTGPFTDIVDEHDQFRTGGFLTLLGDVVGLRYEDFGALAGESSGGSGVGALSADATQAARAAAARGTASFSFDGASYSGRLVAESVHATGATILAAFTTGLQAGSAAITRNRFGAGEAWYVATQPDHDALAAVVEALVSASGVRPVVGDLPAGVEAARRGDLVTLINHGDDPALVAVSGTDAETGAAVAQVPLEPQGVAFILSPVEALSARAESFAGATNR